MNQSSRSTDLTTQNVIPKRAILCAATILSCIAVAYMAKGFYHQVLDRTPNIPCDGLARWQEEQYVLKGQNFYEVRLCWLAEKSSKPIPITAHSASVDPVLGVPAAGYPPWSYFTGAAFFWPSNMSLARYLFGLANLISIIVIAACAYIIGKPYGREAGWLFSAATLAMGSTSYTLGNGQYGLLVLACLLAALWFDEHEHPLLSGLMLGLSLLKPTMSLPFLACFLVKRRWLSLAVAIAYTAVGSVFTWWLTGTDPLTMLRQMQKFSLEQWSFHGSQDLFAAFSWVGIDRAILMRIVAIGVMIPACALMFLWRRSSMLTLFVIAGVAGRLWTYHRNYDNAIMTFLLLSLALIALREQSKYLLACFIVIGIILWLPPRMGDITAAYFVLPMILLWMAAVAVVLKYTPRSDLSTG